MGLLEQAEYSLNKSLGSKTYAIGQAHAQDSIAASLLQIARKLSEKNTVHQDDIELVVRRLLDTAKVVNVRTSKKDAKK